MLPRLIILFAAGLAPVCAHTAAPDIAPLTESTYLDELPVVLSVTRLSQPKSETPAAVTIIDRDMIRASGVRKIPDLLWLVPGFLVGYDSAIQASAAYHGFSDEHAKRLQVLVDGRSVYNTLSGGMFWIDLPLAIDDIERIEVIRGPNAASFGSNSFLGVINIITRHASQDQGTFAKLASGEHNVRDGVLRQGWTGAHGQSRLTLSYQQDDGFNTKPDHSKIPIATFRGDYRIDPSNTLDLQLGFNAENHGMGDYNDLVRDAPREAHGRNHFQLLRWRHADTPENEVSVQFFHNYRRYDENYFTEPLDLGSYGVVTVPVSYDYMDESYDLELQHLRYLSPDWRFVWGAGARYDRGRSLFLFDDGDWRTNRVFTLFGNVEWRVTPDSIVNLGAMWERHRLFGTELSPRIALNHHLSPRHTLRVDASRATSMPTLVDEYANASYKYQDLVLDPYHISAGGMKPETLQSSEIGYLGQIPEIGTTIDVRIFRDRTHDLLSQATIPAEGLINQRVTTVHNEGSLEIRGAEMQLDFRPQPATRFILSYASLHTTATDFITDTKADVREYEGSVPVFVGSLLAAHRFSSQWEASAFYHRIRDTIWFGNGDFVNRYGRLDVRLARDYRVEQYKGQLAVTVQNTGPDTRSFRKNNVFDRRTFVTLTLNR